MNPQQNQNQDHPTQPLQPPVNAPDQAPQQWQQPQFQPSAPQPAAPQQQAQSPVANPFQPPEILPQSKGLHPLAIVAMVVGGIVLLAGAGIVAAMAFMGTSDETSKQSKLSNTDSSPEQSTPLNTATPADRTTLEGKSISDPELGYTINAKVLDIGTLKIPEKYAETQAGKTPVAIEFSNTDTNKVYGSAKNVSLSVIAADGTKYSQMTSLYTDQLKANNMVSLSDASESNDTVSGWVVYHVPTESLTSLKLQYRRLATKIIGSNTTIPAKDFEISLR